MLYRVLFSTHPPPSLLVRNWVDPPPKNKQGIGTSTYMRAAGTVKYIINFSMHHWFTLQDRYNKPDSMGHQLLYIAQACHPKKIDKKNQ